MFTLKTPEVTVAETDVGADAGHIRFPPVTLSKMSNLKKNVVPLEPPNKFPLESVSRP